MIKKGIFGFRLLLIVGIATVAFNSCSKDNDDKKPAIQVKNDNDLTQTVYADKIQGVSGGVTFTTTGAWTSTIKTSATPASVSQLRASEATWISISPDHGDEAGDHTIVISLEINTTGADRTAFIIISSGGTKITITVTQKGRTENGKIPTDPNKFQLDAFGPSMVERCGAIFFVGTGLDKVEAISLPADDYAEKWITRKGQFISQSSDKITLNIPCDYPSGQKGQIKIIHSGGKEYITTGTFMILEQDVGITEALCLP
jgi:hypothetical protein